MVVLALVGGRAGLAAPSCPPALTLQGDEDQMAQVGAALRRRGIATEGAPGCPTVLVRLDRAGPRGLAVTIVEIVNEDTRREFGTTDLALAFIESWARR